MAQVTMTSQEYLELVDKSRRYDALEQEMLGGVEVELDLKNSYSKINLHITAAYTEWAKSEIVRKVTKVAAAEQEVMDWLFSDNKHFLSLQYGYFTRNWNEQPAPGEIDMFTNAEFKSAWAAAEARAKAAEETDQEEE